MMELILIAVGAAGFGLAGYWDLRTTEFPDWLPYSMIAIALAVRAAFAFLSSDWSILADSVVVGAVFLAIGLAMYFARQWGDGDAWLLGALGFIMPSPMAAGHAGIFPFPVALIFNFFIAAFFYVIIYSLALSFTTPGAWSGFVRSFRRECRGTIVLVCSASIAYFAFLTAMYVSLRIAPPPVLLIIAFPVLVAFISVFYRYGLYIEKSVFKRRIPVSKLRAGDVPIGGKWRCLTPKEVASLKRKGGFIWIKEGVRFAPVFLIAFLLTLLAGDVFSLVFSAV
jgi:Flp pilus assembly protein protease CpaA